MSDERDGEGKAEAKAEPVSPIEDAPPAEVAPPPEDTAPTENTAPTEDPPPTSQADAPAIPAPAQPPAPRRRLSWPRWLNALDGLAIVLFLVAAILAHVGRLRGADHFIWLAGDAGNLASFAAGLDHPDLFARDAVLDDSNNFKFYATIHIPLLRALFRITGDYGVAFASMLGVHVFVQAVGFYTLGRVIFRSRVLAASLAIASLMLVNMNLGEWWGTFRDPLPRSTFSALLPFVLAAAFHYRATPRAWPWILGLFGLLMYVHPVSAPAWALALWAGFWLYHPKEWRFVERVKRAFIAGLAFLLVAGPFALNYQSSHAHGKTASYDTVIGIMKARFMKGYFDMPGSAWAFVKMMADIYLLPAAAVGLALVLVLRSKDRRAVAYVGAWAIVMAIVAVLIPTVEHSVARSLRRVPFEFDLIRNIRYFVPLMLVFCLWPLAEASQRLQRKIWHAGLALVGLVLTVAWCRSRVPEEMSLTAAAWKAGRFSPAPRATADLEGYTALKELTPPGASVLPFGKGVEPLIVRYYALRSVVHSRKDGGAFAYANHTKLLAWWPMEKRIKRISGGRDRAARTREVLALARDLGAQYVLTTPSDVTYSATTTQGAEAVFSNRKMLLLRVIPESAPPPAPPENDDDPGPLPVPEDDAPEE